MTDLSPLLKELLFALLLLLTNLHLQSLLGAIHGCLLIPGHIKRVRLLKWIHVGGVPIHYQRNTLLLFFALEEVKDCSLLLLSRPSHVEASSYARQSILRYCLLIATLSTRAFPSGFDLLHHLYFLCGGLVDELHARQRQALW